MEQIYFLFGGRIKVEHSVFILCLIQEFESKEIKKNIVLKQILPEESLTLCTNIGSLSA
jgi:hypothetical protein